MNKRVDNQFEVSLVEMDIRIWNCQIKPAIIINQYKIPELTSILETSLGNRTNTNKNIGVAEQNQIVSILIKLYCFSWKLLDCVILVFSFVLILL